MTCPWSGKTFLRPAGYDRWQRSKTFNSGDETMRAVTSIVYKASLNFACMALAAMMAASFALGQAQATAADLGGSVTDPSGAFVAGATVTAKSTATGLTRTVTTNSSGDFQIIGLPPGDYDVTAEAATFKKVVISGVRLTVGQKADLPIRL